MTTITFFFLSSRLRCEEMDLAGTYFITAVTWQRRPIFRHEKMARLMIDVLFHYREQKYLLHEFVIMPDHLYVLLTPVPQTSLERAVQFIKGGFSYRLEKGHQLVWQGNFLSDPVRDMEEFERHRHHIYFNPVRAGLVADPAEYPYSSASASFRLDEISLGLRLALKESA